jgi:hypothetical protein
VANSRYWYLIESLADTWCGLRLTIRTRQPNGPPLDQLSFGNLTSPAEDIYARFIENRVSRVTLSGCVPFMAPIQWTLGKHNAFYEIVREPAALFSGRIMFRSSISANQ